MGMLEAHGGRASLLARACGQREAFAAKPGAFCVADRWHRSDPDATAEVVSTSGRRGIRRVTEDRINTGYLPSIPQRCLLSIRHLESLRTVHSATRFGARRDRCAASGAASREGPTDRGQRSAVDAQEPGAGACRGQDRGFGRAAAPGPYRPIWQAQRDAERFCNCNCWIWSRVYRARR